MLSRVIWATRVDLQIAIFCTLFPLIFGTIVGILVGYYGGWLDTIFGRIVDLVVTFPFLVLVIAIVAVLGPGLINMYIADRRRRLGVLRPADARRDPGAEADATMPPPPACSATATLRLVFRHLLPNAITPVHRLLGDRHGARHPAGLEPRLSRPRRAAADGGMGRADRRRQELHEHRPGGCRSSPASPSSSPALGFSLIGDGLADLFRRRR